MKKQVYKATDERLRHLLRATRKKAKISQIVLGKRLGYYKTFVSKYETGERELSVYEFLAVAEALKLDPAEVLEKVKA